MNMKFTKSSGAWLDKTTLKGGETAVLTTEALEQEGQNGTQIVAKIKIDNGNPANVAINGATKNALIDAFGSDSLQWMNKPLNVHVEKTTIAGKRATVLYLIPSGFEITEDAEGYVVIKPSAEAVAVAEEQYGQ